jgi:hypothetical protein
MYILRPNTPLKTSIKLETRKGNPIENSQFHEIGKFAVKEYENILKRFNNSITIRTGINPIYNCHGLVFASRRTGIDNLPWDVIFNDDGYTEVINVSEVLPGDIVIYFGSDGTAEHSGIVLENKKDVSVQIPLILSKWGSGGEIIHLAIVVPPEYPKVMRYYRVTK